MKKGRIALNASSVLFEGPYGAVKMPTRVLLKSILRSGVSRRNPEADYSSLGIHRGAWKFDDNEKGLRLSLIHLEEQRDFS